MGPCGYAASFAILRHRKETDAHLTGHWPPVTLQLGATDGLRALHEQDGSGHGVHPGGYVFGLLFVPPNDALQSGRHALKIYMRPLCAKAATWRNLCDSRKKTIWCVCAAGSGSGYDNGRNKYHFRNNFLY